MKNTKKKCIILICMMMILSLGCGMTTGAKSKDVTKKYRGKVADMLNNLDGYLCYDIAFDPPNGKFVFNDYAKTSMILYINYGYFYTKGNAYLKTKTKKDMKTYFGSSAKFKVKKFNGYGKSYKMQNMFQSENGTIRFVGGEYGEAYPTGKVTKILQTSKNRFTVTYKEYLRHAYMSGTTYCGTYKVYLKKASNKFGFVITNIRRTKVAW